MNEKPNQAAQLSIRDYITVLFRRRRTIMNVFLAIMLAGLVAVMLSRPTYKSSVDLLLEDDKGPLSGAASQLPIFKDLVPPSGHDIPSQMNILLSPRVIVDAANAAKIPIPANYSDIEDLPFKVKADQMLETDVVSMTVMSRNQDYVKKMAVELPKSFRNFMLDSKQSGVTKALAFVQQRHADEVEQLAQAELNLRKFNQSRKVYDVPSQQELLLMQSMQGKGQLDKVKADLSGAEAQLASLLSVRRQTPDQLDTLTKITNVDNKQALLDKISELQNDRQKQLLLFKPNNIAIRQIDTQIAEYRTQIKNLPQNVSTHVLTRNPEAQIQDDKIAEARGQVASIVAGIARLEAAQSQVNHELDGLGAMQLEQNKLQRNIDRHTVSEAELASTFDDLSMREKENDDPVGVLTVPVPPEVVTPLAVKVLLIFLLALMCAVGAAMIQEFTDDRIYNPDDATNPLEAPPLGYIPFVDKTDTVMLSDAGRSSSLLETYRLLRSNVQFAAVDEPLNSLLITSSLPGEGKSITACNLATAAALNGRRVILVDADLRRPTLHSKFGLKRQPGLTSVLVGHSTLEEALQETGVPGLQLLGCGPIPPNPAELLSSRSMRELHTALKEVADLVIFDSSPVLATADAQVLAAQVDGVIFIVQLGQTKKSAVRFAGDLLRQAHSRTLGVVFNKMKIESKPGYYGYGSGGYGYGYGYGYYYYGTYHYTAKYGAEVSDDSQARKELAAEFEAVPRREVPENGKPEDNKKSDQSGQV